MFRQPFIVLSIIMLTVFVGCRGGEGFPIPIQARTGDLDGRLTLPPTFTPSATATLLPTHSPASTERPTTTFTLTPTLEPLPTRTQAPSPSPTPTWTPDTRHNPPTRIPQGTAFPTLPPGTQAAIAGGCTGNPNAPNLLVNGGFEGLTHSQGFDDIAVPDNWAAFWRREGEPVTYDPDNQDGYRRPEMRIIPNSPSWNNPPRVLVGSQALYISGGNKVFDGGVFQQVAVAENKAVCLTGFAHAWSAHRSDDVFHSTLNTEDDRKNIGFQLGIDPTGQTNPWLPSVIWGPVVNLYDTYQAIPGVRALSPNNSVTVYVRGYSRWRFDHNDLFFDDIRLITITP